MAETAIDQGKPTQYFLRKEHRPALPSGAYSLVSKWHVTVDNKTEAQCDSKVDFWVAGERFCLNPADIHSVYPPQGGRGSYENSLPHVVLSRDTLPWERSADGDKAPWLALLLLHEAEAAQCKVYTTTLDALPRQARESKTGEHLNDHQNDADPVQAIDLPAQILHDCMPDADELKLLCHVRARQVAGQTMESAAVVLGKRLPAKGRNTVHLISVENRYRGHDFDSGGQAGCTLVVLHSWSFSCECAEHPESETLAGLFSRLGSGWLQLPPALNPHAESYLNQGLVPLQHGFRSGESGVSWYAGPLIPPRPLLDAPQPAKLPAACADSLLGYDTEIGMLRVGYAAAWELGRLLVLQNRRILAALQKWRRQQIHHAHAEAAAAAGSPGCHLPTVQCACVCECPQPPEELTQWLQDLLKFKGMPTNYLLADERMLPPESIRFFTVDPDWMKVLLDGVFGAARVPSTHQACCEDAEAAMLKSFASNKLTGFLLRSSIVAGWPGLQVYVTAADRTRLQPYHYAQLSPAVALYLFEGEFSTLTIQQTPDILHMSVEGQLQNPQLWKDSSQRVLKLSAFNQNSSHLLARQLLGRMQKFEVAVQWR